MILIIIDLLKLYRYTNLYQSNEKLYREITKVSYNDIITIRISYICMNVKLAINKIWNENRKRIGEVYAVNEW